MHACCSSSSSGAAAAQWTAILGLLKPREALAMFRQMQHQGISPDRRALVALANAAAAARDLDHARMIHRCAIESGLVHGDSQLATAIVNMYGKCGDAGSARIVFDAMGAPGVVAWTALLSGMEESEGKEAIRLFRSMQLRGVAPNAVTFLAVLPYCDDLQLGTWIHGLYDESRSRTLEVIDVVVGTAMLAMYGRIGAMAVAEDLFQEMPERNTVTWNIMIAAYAQSGHCREAIGFYSRMLHDGQHRPSKVTFFSVFQACQSGQFLVHARSIHGQATETGLIQETAVATSIISSYGKCGSVEDARAVFDSIAGQDRDSACWTAMIGASGENGDASSTLVLFRKMELEGLPARKVTLVAAINACAGDSSCLGDGRALHKRVTALGLTSDTMVANALLSMYGKSGKLDDACEIFRSVPRSNTSAALVSWNTLIAAFAVHRGHLQALELYQLMLQEGIRADGRTFMGMLDGCTHGGRVEQGCYCFGLMSDHWIAPEKEHYGCVADLLGRAGWLAEAEEFIGKMAAGVADDFKWMSLLGACKMHGDVARAERAAKRAVEMNPKNKAAAYVAVSGLISR